MRNSIYLLSVLFISNFNLSAQSVTFPDDDIERGYYDRPYKRYEAEPGKCLGNALFLNLTTSQTELQSEASNQIAAQLTEKDSYIQWTNDEAADGLTIRFSLPDSEDGKGTKGTLALYVNDEYVQDIILDSYWAWQYTLKYGNNKYPDNTPASNKFPRMRFDESHYKLAKKIPAGATFKIVKTTDNSSVYTIDFIELEPIPAAITFDDITDDNKTLFDDPTKNLGAFIQVNGGKTIFIPEGKYEVDRKINITSDNTKIIGAGMWYTELYFTASSDDRSTYNKRGIETDNSNIVIEGLYINTINNKRYYDNNASYQVGKGFMGSFGANSIIRNVWVEHFECGGWIANYNGKNSDNLLIQHSRFRNNYADGLNLCSGIKNAIVEKCSFRNNGDDDMASWSSSELCINNTYRYNTAENNWRASSLGFFGGQQNKASHCVIIDPMEAGLRVNCDFAGKGFGTEGYNEFNDISIYRGGVNNGTPGVEGDFWGNRQGAIHIASSAYYDLQNIKFENINLYDSKNDAIHIASSNHKIKNLQMKNIHINGTGRYGIFYDNAQGNGFYCSMSYENIGAETDTNDKPDSFIFIEDCNPQGMHPVNEEDNLKVYSINGSIILSNCRNIQISIYDITGRECYQAISSSDKITIPGFKPGLYIVKSDTDTVGKKIFVKK